jgi:hypothetical protein
MEVEDGDGIGRERFDFETGVGELGGYQVPVVNTASCEAAGGHGLSNATTIAHNANFVVLEKLSDEINTRGATMTIGNQNNLVKVGGVGLLAEVSGIDETGAQVPMELLRIGRGTGAVALCFGCPYIPRSH